ncbi:MAG: T9SS type A sorting domain-containing protein [Chloroflexia bacterium]|nr:T9SS type A sorting domain-containing protein [Chloroflexia bacterium]
MKSRFLLIVFFAVLAKTAYCQIVYYSLNGSTNPNLTNSWTRDNSGATLLLPPSNFTDPSDVFIIDGENMNISNHWIVAGEVRVLSGSLNDPDRYKFQAKKFSIYNNTSYMFIGNPGDIHLGTLIIGEQGQLNTGNSFGGNCIEIDDSACIKGNLVITNPMFGAGKFKLEKGGTLSTTNGEICKTGSCGQIRVTGARYFSKEAKYHYTSNVGNFYTGDALPDTVAELYIDNGQNTTTTFTSSTIVQGTFSSAGAWGGSNANSSILLGANKIKCLGNISINGGVTISGVAKSALILSGSGTSSLSLPSLTVDSFVFDRSATLNLNGSLTVLSKLNLVNGKVNTNSYVVQLGTSSEGKAYTSGGWIVGTLAVFKDKISTSTLLFPVGGNNYSAPLTITYSTLPTSDGLIKISFSEGTGTTALNPSIVDGTLIKLIYYSKFLLEGRPVIVSGGSFDVSLDAKNISGLTKSSTSTLLISDIGGSQFYIKGDRSLGSDILINRSNISGSNTFGRYYIGGTKPIITVSASVLTITAQANSTKTFDITSNTNWTAASDQSWLTLNTASGSNNATITLTATANPSAATRTATVTVAGINLSSKLVSVTQDPGTTRIVETENIKISIFPNPVVSVLYINGLTKNSSVSIVDLQGKIVISKQITNDHVNIESLSKGLYLIRITNGDETIIRKFLKQ